MQLKEDSFLDFVFNGEGPDLNFVEVENEQGHSVNAGDWRTRKSDGRQVLRVRVAPSVNVLGKIIHDISTSKGFTPPSMQNLPEKLMLSVSELSEALEEHRGGKPLKYYKCGECGQSSMWPIGEHETPATGIFGWIMSKFGVGALECPGRIDKPEGVLVEIADSIIRNLHMMHSIIQEDNSYDDLSIEGIIREKVAYNSGRPLQHGKRY